MNDKFAKLHDSIINMRLNVIEAKGGQKVKGLSEPVVEKNNQTNTKQAKSQEKD